MARILNRPGRLRKKSERAKPAPWLLTGISGTLASVVIWGGFLQLQRLVPEISFSFSPAARTVLVLLFTIDGAVTVLWSLWTLYRQRAFMEFAGAGPYRLVRHPIYGAILWNGTATLCSLTGSLVVLLAAIPLNLLWTWLVRFEETALYEKYGSPYRQYCLRTGLFFPKLKSLRQLENNHSDT